MFTIEHIQNKDSTLDYFELKNPVVNSKAKIFLNLGGSLQELNLKKKSIFKDLHPLSYNNTYASAILFPFAGRVENGLYSFREKKYQLALNDKHQKSATHGFISHKRFSVVEKKSSLTKAEITLAYTERNKTPGFPYEYDIHLHYTLTIDTLTLEVTIKNNGNFSFPFSVGWHPYFYSEDLFNSYITLNSDQKLLFNDKMIPVEIKKIRTDKDLQVKDKKFDDCFILKNNYIYFKTPNYKLKFTSSSEENYFQVYTPSKENAIAIEPLTGPSNNFNNKLGLQILNSKDSYSVKWIIKIMEN